MFDPVHAAGWLALGRLALEILRGAIGLAPRPPLDVHEARRRAKAELCADLLNARLARDLGYRLCRCAFPPRPMLWNAASGAFVCETPGCGREER